jgi:hypothetical protein
MQTHRYASALPDDASRSLELPDGPVNRIAAAADLDAAAVSRYAHFVVPNKRGDGFRASVRGHMFELVDPDSTHGLVPTPLDLLTAAVAADIAWYARRLLRDHDLDDYVSVAARVRLSETPAEPGGVDVTVEVSRHAASLQTALAAALEGRLVAYSSLTPTLRVRQA